MSGHHAPYELPWLSPDFVFILFSDLSWVANGRLTGIFPWKSSSNPSSSCEGCSHCWLPSGQVCGPFCLSTVCPGTHCFHLSCCVFGVPSKCENSCLHFISASLCKVLRAALSQCVVLMTEFSFLGFPASSFLASATLIHIYSFVFNNLLLFFF